MSFSVRRLAGPKRRSIPWRKLLTLAVLLARPVGKILQNMQKKRQEEERWKRLLIVGTSVIVGVSMLLIAFALLVRIGALTLSSFADITGAPLKEDEGMTNVLLLGQGNEDHDGIDLTDTIMVASIGMGETSRLAPRPPLGTHSRKTPSVALLSLPRDLYFLHADSLVIEKGKLNALWRDERIALQRQGLERREASLKALQGVAHEVGVALGIPMHYALKVDFTAFEQIVDALGGVELTVPETINDTEYPGPNYTYETFHMEAGLQHLDGKTALKYARTRHTSSDFDRSSRQQQILQALNERAKSSGALKKPGKLLELSTILHEHIETDLSTREMVTLAGLGRELSREHFVSMQLSDSNGLYDAPLAPGGLLYAPPRDLFGGAAVFLPVSIPEFPVTFKQVQTLGSLLFRHRDLYREKPKVAVFNGGGPEGSARRLAREFIKFGFEVSEITNLPEKQKVPRSFLAQTNSSFSRESTEWFRSFLSFEEGTLENLNPKPTVANTDLVIVLGEDYEFQFFQDLSPPNTSFRGQGRPL